MKELQYGQDVELWALATVPPAAKAGSLDIVEARVLEDAALGDGMVQLFRRSHTSRRAIVVLKRYRFVISGFESAERHRYSHLAGC